MKMKIKIDGSTTATQLFALGTMLCSMGGSVAAGADRVTVTLGPLKEADVKMDAAAPAETTGTPPAEAPAAEAKTRKPRAKKDEPAADATPPADPEAAAAAAAQAAIANAQQAPADAAPAAAGAFNEAQVQNVATAVARAHGADVVKAKIAELGATRIATMTPEQLDSLGTYLTQVLDGTIVITK